jgi:hypothetical protein
MKTLCDDLSCLLIDCKNVTFAFVQSKMVDYILGVSDPIKWHSANLKMNSDHYASWMVHLGGARLVYIYSLYTIFLHCLYGLNQILNSQFLFNLRIDYKCCR